MRVSIAIPCYNESKNLPLLVSRCSEVSRGRNIEFILVDNGSSDNTDKVLKKLLRDQKNIISTRLDINQGYGHGIIQGLGMASGDILGWTHADMQTDPMDIIEGLSLIEKSESPKNIFVKGLRYGRPLADIFFTFGMSIFETLLLRTWLRDINAQPTLFHRSFYEKIKDAPEDFSLDLFIYCLARRKNLLIRRFPVKFGERAYGVSSWNINFPAKIKFIKRTLTYSLNLSKSFKNKENN